MLKLTAKTSKQTDFYVVYFYFFVIETTHVYYVDLLKMPYIERL